MKYQIWDKISDLVTPGIDPVTRKQVWTAHDYIENVAPWAGLPGAKAIITTGLINCGVFMEFNATVDHYKRQGLQLDGLTDNEILQAIEDFEDNPPIIEDFPSTDERIAAMLEALVLIQMGE